MIKLFKIDTLKDGTERFQSQLQIGTTVSDFVREPNGKMKSFDYGENGFDFYEYKEPYEIVNDIKEMNMQPL